jgi:hypothetical protein
MLLVSCSGRGPIDVDRSTMQDLNTIRNLTVYFGHQSVGANILEGFREIEQHAGMGPEIKDSLIGVNGDPVGKCEDFARKLAGLAQPPDIALMKFCYIDFDESTNEAKLFATYAATLDRLQAKYPSTIFVPVTVPLTIRPAAWKRLAKFVLGREDVTSALNVKRGDFNRMILNRYADRVIFDLARAESTFPDGSRNLFSWEGQTAVSLVDEYSSDGSHLNRTGSVRVATEMIHALAVAARAKSARVSPDASGSTSISQ